MFKEAGQDAIILKHNIDQPFVTSLEQKDETIKFQRIDADITESFREEIDENDEEIKNQVEVLTELFRKVLGEENLEVKVEKLKNENVSSVVTLSEESRRMQDMMKMYSMPGMDTSMFGASETLVLNANNKLVQYVFNNKESEEVNIVC
jgi:molecular chaperone HtpG